MFPRSTSLVFACSALLFACNADDKDRIARQVVAAEGDIGVVVDGHNAFTWALHGQLVDAEPDANAFYSPFSITTALSMTHAGAAGDTAAQLGGALGVPAESAPWHDALGALGRDLDGPLGRGYTLRVANRLFGQEAYPFEQPFLDVLAADYGAPLETWDFIADADGGRRHINAWVADQTGGHIDPLLPDGALDAATRLVIANAIHFDAAWATPFDPDQTAPYPFARANGGPVDVDMMWLNVGDLDPDDHAVRSGRVGDVTVLQVPYADNELSFVALMPDDPAGLGALETSLDASIWQQHLDALAPARGTVGVPRLSLSHKVDIVPRLEALGITDLFVAGRADLSGMVASSVDQLYVTDIFHEAFVNIDEQGTEAAAATAVVVGRLSAGPSVVLGRPFVFAIRDDLTGALLFVGRYVDPDAA